MQNIKEVLLSNRFKSFYWRAGAMMAIALLNAIIENLSSFGLSTELVVLLGLILGEITKVLNNFSQGKTA